MPRNPAHTMTAAETMAANANRALLVSRMGERVSLDYVKRDGTPSVLDGTVKAFVGTRKGNQSTEAVTLETAKGERSANLWNIKAIN